MSQRRRRLLLAATAAVSVGVFGVLFAASRPDVTPAAPEEAEVTFTEEPEVAEREPPRTEERLPYTGMNSGSRFAAKEPATSSVVTASDTTAAAYDLLPEVTGDYVTEIPALAANIDIPAGSPDSGFLAMPTAFGPSGGAPAFPSLAMAGGGGGGMAMPDIGAQPPGTPAPPPLQPPPVNTGDPPTLGIDPTKPTDPIVAGDPTDPNTPQGPSPQGPAPQGPVPGVTPGVPAPTPTIISEVVDPLATPVPEPASWVVLLMGLAALAAVAQKKSRRRQSVNRK